VREDELDVLKWRQGDLLVVLGQCMNPISLVDEAMHLDHAILRIDNPIELHAGPRIRLQLAKAVEARRRTGKNLADPIRHELEVVHVGYFRQTRTSPARVVRPERIRAQYEVDLRKNHPAQLVCAAKRWCELNCQLDSDLLMPCDGRIKCPQLSIEQQCADALTSREVVCDRRVGLYEDCISFVIHVGFVEAYQSLSGGDQAFCRRIHD
jgi:hypothetical protein